jgi:hypothetical protein
MNKAVYSIIIHNLKWLPASRVLAYILVVEKTRWLLKNYRISLWINKLQLSKYCHTDDSVNAVVVYLITQLFYSLLSFLADSQLDIMHLVGYQLIYESSS